MDFSKAYRFQPGFSFRRESFGGILYHYEGVRPDPRISFVDSPFLLDLLERVESGPLDELLAAVGARFGLDEGQLAAVRDFFATLEQRGALVARAA
jgi:putative mycofactocin binding protein MftB